MSKYRITLTPVDKFFFGGDMTFSVGKKDSEFNEQYSSYIIRSMMFPQQTSLLGMLRFLILRNAGNGVFCNNKIADTTAAEKLIGQQSFTVNADHNENNFGMIKSISSVKIGRKDNNRLLELNFCPLMEGVSFADGEDGVYGSQSLTVPNINKEQYDAKEGLPNDDKLTDGTSLIAKDDDDKDVGVFVEDRRIGVNRDIKSGKTDDDALFKQIAYRFNNRIGTFCFVFYADVDDSINLVDYSGQIVSIGGDNSQFVIQVCNEPKTENDIKAEENTIRIISPTYLNRNDAQKAQFAITRLMPFRFLTSNIHLESYHILSGNMKRTQKYELYAPGSIFYFANKEERDSFAQIIDSYKEFKQIGYNEYK